MPFDAHQHFWQLANPFTNWPTPSLGAIYRDFGAEDLAPLLADTGVSGTILVQAAPSIAETEYCLALAARHDFVKGVVGWIDFEAADALAQLERLARDPLLKGLRPMVQAIGEPGWLLRPDFAPIFEAMVMLGLRFDALVFAHQLRDLDELARLYPSLPIVLDHAGKPQIAAGEFDSWAKDISQLASTSSVHCKLSGLWTEAGTDHSESVIGPYAAHLLAAFGPERLMWGSDWPVLELVGTYADWLTQCVQLLSDLPDAARSGILGTNGMRFYGIEA